jgi:ATP-binding cassette subfamily A (ABC1) protein 3
VDPFIYDRLHEGLQAGLPVFILLCFVYPCINIIKYITTEKEKQLKEAMKIMGLDR